MIVQIGIISTILYSLMKTILMDGEERADLSANDCSYFLFLFEVVSFSSCC